MIRQFSFLLTTITLIVSHASAQSILGSVNVKGDFEVESIEKGDSVLLMVSPDNTMMVSDQKHQTYQARDIKVDSDLYWIRGSEISQPLAIRRFSDESLVGFEENRKKQNHFLYFTKPSKKTEILNVYTSEGTTFTQSPISIPLTGKVITTFLDTCLNVILLDKNTSTLKILRLREATIVGEKIIKIPFKLDSYKDDEIEFINPKGHIRLDQSFAKVKFFKDENIISLVLDEPILPYEEPQNPPFKTSLFRYDLITDKTDIKLFFEFTKRIFRSYLIDQLLFKVIDSREGDHLLVFDIHSQKQLTDQLILPKELYKTTSGFYRNGRDFKIKKDLLKSLSVNIGYSDLWSPVIIVEKLADEYVVTVGNFSNYKGHLGVISPGTPGLGLIVSAIGTSIKQARDNPAMSAYTYLIGSTSKKFSYKADLNYYKKNIDETEASSKASKNLKFKGYISTQYWSAGLYCFDGSSQLSIIKFPR